MDNILLLMMLPFIVLPIALFMLNRKAFYYSLILVYPIIGQTVGVKISIFNLEINPSRIFGLIVFLLTLVDVFLKPPKSKKLEIITISFCIYALSITSVFSLYRLEGLLWGIKLCTWLFILLAAIKTFQSERDIEQIQVVVSIAATLMIISFFLSKMGLYGKTQVYETGAILYGGGFSSGKIFGYYLAIAIPIIAVKKDSENKFLKYLSYLIIVLSLVVIVLTYVRAPVLAILVGFITYHYFVIKGGKDRPFAHLVKVLVVILTVGSLVWISRGTHFTARWFEICRKISEGNIEKVGSGRVGALIKFGDYLLNRASTRAKVFGAGLGSSYYLLGNKKFVHNDFAEIFMGCGLIGFILYLLVLGTIFRALRRKLGWAATPKRVGYIALALSDFSIFLIFNMTNVTSGVVVLIPWALFTGATLGLGGKPLDEERHRRSTTEVY